jgi:hypothetical protein
MAVTPEVPRDNLIQVHTVSGQGHLINVMVREIENSIAQGPCVISDIVLKEIREYRHVAMGNMFGLALNFIPVTARLGNSMGSSKMVALCAIYWTIKIS